MQCNQTILNFIYKITIWGDIPFGLINQLWSQGIKYFYKKNILTQE